MTSLHIDFLRDTPDPAVFAGVVQRSFEHTTCLHFVGSMVSMDFILHALSSFPALETVALTLSFFHLAPLESPPYRFPPKWRSLYLKVHDPIGQEFFEKLLSLDTIPVLSSLCAHDTWPTDNSFMERYLRHVGRHLQYLQLDAGHFWAVRSQITDADGPIGLLHSTGLRWLDLRVDRVFFLMESILLTLRHLRSRNLVTINLLGARLRHGPPGEPLDLSEWREIDVILTGEWFSTLESFTIIIESEIADAVTSDFNEHMPMSITRGIFRVVHRPRPWKEAKDFFGMHV
ncbi:hypothetical protein FB451DRAFT_1263880 [Mycena latifolia]|nr:hypothetical protein FB451DRAFT_1263880 [Mycena latifolia]